MTTSGVLEYILSSGRSILIIYIGLIPVSTILLLASTLIVYVVLSILSLPPILTIHSPPYLVVGILLFLQVLLAHAVVLGSLILSVGVSGPVMEVLGWILPIATGGFTPISNMPQPLQIIALSTPYSYPVELLRYSILGIETILPLDLILPISLAYSLLFLLSSILYFKYTIRKIMMRGIGSI
ncbi:MAG: hypothetical protein QW695_01265 [Candidatus Bathyarchaeia archaeon]